MKGSRGQVPKLVYHGSDDGEETNPYVTAIVDQSSMLTERYHPPPVWGTSGHLQTTMFSLKETRPGLDLSCLESKRHYVTLADGTRISYDLFPPFTVEATDGEDITLVVCPGLANSSLNTYIRAFTLQATQDGYRTAVLNNLGVLEEELTTARIFNFGSTEEFGAMVESIRQSFPNTSMIAVGFSLGANIVCKYFGEDSQNQKGFISGISACQGYDFNRMRTTMNTWSKLKKLYAKQLTKKVQATVLNNWHHLKDTLSAPDHSSEGEASRTTKDNLHSRVKRSVSMTKLDELVTIKLTGHDSVEKYYSWASSSHYLDNINLPMLFVNSGDDPLFCKESLQHPTDKAKSHQQSLMVLTKHGGHLGFFTKTGSATVDPTTWLERMLLQYTRAVINVNNNSLSIPKSIDTLTQPDNSVTDDEEENDINSDHQTNHQSTTDSLPEDPRRIQAKTYSGRRKETDV